MNRVGRKSSAALAQAKPVTPEEWKKIEEPVAPKARVKVVAELSLTPLQHRALLATCESTHTSLEEAISSATVFSLTDYNSADWNTYRLGIVAGVLAQFPERERELGDFCDALELCFKSDGTADRISRELSRKAGAR